MTPHVLVAAGARVFVLPPDVQLLPGGASGVAADEVVVVRPGSRERPRVLPTEAAALLERFRTPTTLAGAVLAHCRDRGSDPQDVLESAYPVLAALCRAELLAVEGSAGAVPAGLRGGVGDRVGPAVLVRLVRALRDSEVWQGELADGAPCAVKVLAPGPWAGDALARELAALTRLRGDGAPAVLAVSGPDEGVEGRLVTSWVAGEPADLAARRLGDPVSAAPARRRLALAVLDAYVALHARRTLHGDVHAGNVLIEVAAGAPRVVLVDFGLAVLPGLPLPPRAAGGESVEPEAAAALLAGRPAPDVTPAGEQYALATLLWRLLTDAPYLDLDPERAAALRQVAAAAPAGLGECGAAAWPAGEAVLRRALATSPADRWPSLVAMRAELAAALPAVGPPPPVAPSWTSALAELEAGGPAWCAATPDQVLAVAWALQRAAVLTAEADLADLADAWGLRERAQPGRLHGPVLAAHALLAEYRRTGSSAALARAVRLADNLPGQQPYELCRGPLARLLLRTECSDPTQARRPPGVVDG